MKKHLLVATLALLGAVSAHATADTVWGGAPVTMEPSVKYTTVKATTTVLGLLISTGAPISVIRDLTQFYSWVEIQNLNVNADDFCGDDSVKLSTQVTNVAGLGYEIARASGTFIQSKRFDVVPGHDFFCQSGDGNINRSTATIVRGR